MTYEIYEVKTFSEVYDILDGSEKQWIDNVRLKLRENPTGKILRFSWFREKKYLNKRLYYLVDENLKKILILDFSSKKDQQKVISTITKNMEYFLDLLKKI